MSRPKLLAALAVLSTFAGMARGAEILAPDLIINGLSQDELSINWWNWMISYPAGSNPSTDSTGEFAYLGADQTPAPHPGVFFLAGDLGNPGVRSVTILPGQVLFFPLITVISPIPLFGADEAAVRLDAADTVGTVTELFVRIDGVDAALPPGIASLLDLHRLSPPGTFPWTVPADNIFGVDEGTYESVLDSYWVALAPLAAGGTYELHFHGAGTGTPPLYGPYVYDQTYIITVVPEPGSVVLLGIGAGLGLLGVGRRKARPASPRCASQKESGPPSGG